VIIRNDSFPWSLANAFQKPIRAGHTVSIEEASIDALDSYYKKLDKVYGSDGVICDSFMNLITEEGSLKGIIADVSRTLKTLVEEGK